MSLFKVLSAQSETLRPVPHISSAYSGKALHFHYLFPPEYQTGCRAHPTSYWLGTGGIFPRVKRPGREADHLPAGCSLILACASKPCTGTAVLYVRQSLHEGAEVASSEGTWPFHRCVSYFILCDLSPRVGSSGIISYLGSVRFESCPNTNHPHCEHSCYVGCDAVWIGRHCSKSLQLPHIHDVTFHRTRFVHNTVMRT